jgi:Fic family protein
MRPPFHITPAILTLHGEIEKLCGRLEAWNLSVPSPELRRKNRIRAVQGSLAIEGNTLSLDQVTALLEGKRVLGPAREIMEVQNAIRAYDRLERLDIFSMAGFLKIHGVLMKGLFEKSGKWRSGDVGIQKGAQVTHVAPPAARVPGLMKDLFRYIRAENELSLLVRSCIFHYETSFIHPFPDGNGRIARLWQTALLCKHHPIFAFVPVESMVKRNQKAYYRALEAADRKGESTPFLEFALKMIADSLSELLGEVYLPKETPESRLEGARKHFGQMDFSRKDYRTLFKTLSTATASRDLRLAVSKGWTRKQGDKNRARYRFKAGSGKEPAQAGSLPAPAR